MHQDWLNLHNELRMIPHYIEAAWFGVLTWRQDQLTTRSNRLSVQ